ncbi:unnamed protein product [Rotaria sp. Silwood2]|nr:unnamed protein product [Rotaria sp. Silwood2]
MLTRQGATRLIESEFNRLAKININFPDRTPISPVVYRPTELIMAEKTVATLLSKTLEQTSKFSGKPDQDADEWMKDLTATFRMAHITESQALKIISTFLEGHPKQWFIENITIFESWSIFKAQFIHTYSSPSSKQLASNRLRTHVMKLCKLLDHLYHGLKSSLMKDVLREAPSTPSGFLEQARREENLDRLVTTAARQTNNNDTQATTYSNNSLYRSPQSAESMHYQNSSNMYSKGYSANVYSPQPAYNRFYDPSSSHYPHQAQQSSFNVLRYQSRPLRCYLCQKLGHVARDCRSAKNY